MANDRIYYAIHQAGIRGASSSGAFTAIHGLQEIGMTANFNIRPVFEIGKSSPYQNKEELPELEITGTKVLDGHPLIGVLASVDATSPRLMSRSAAAFDMAVSYFSDTNDVATGTPIGEAVATDMYSSSWSFTLPLEDDMTEDFTAVGNNRVWANDPNISPSPGFVFNGAFTQADAPLAVSGVNDRKHLILATSTTAVDVNGQIADSDVTVLPPDIPGISATGINDLSDPDHAHLSSITVSVDLAREDLNELGTKKPYAKVPTLPIEVTTEIEVTASNGSQISFLEDGIYGDGTQCSTGTNLKERTIRIATCEGTRIYLGTKNTMRTDGQSGGGTGGDNMTITYTFVSFNEMTVMHENDPNTNFNWADRDQYLIEGGSITPGVASAGSITETSVEIIWTAPDGENPVTSQLQINDGTGWSNVSGATTSPAVAGSLTTATEYDFRVQFSDGISTTYSNVITATTT